MSENNNQMPCMYREVPALQAVNRVAGFDPMKFLRRTVSRVTGENVWKLDLRYMRAWFRMPRPNGRVRFRPLRITEQHAIFEAQVYMDRSDAEPVSNFTAQCTREEAAGGDYIQAAQDAALETALSNAGFGIQFVDLTYDGTGEKYGSEVPVSGQAVNENAASAVPITASSLEKREETVAAAAVSAGNTAAVQPVEQVQQAAGIAGQGMPAPAAGMKTATLVQPMENTAGSKAAVKVMGQSAASVTADQPANQSVPTAVKVMTSLPVTPAVENKAGNQSAAAPVKTAGNPAAASATMEEPANQSAPTSVKVMTSLPITPAAEDKSGNQSTMASVKTAGNQPAASVTADQSANQPAPAVVKVMTNIPVTSVAENQAGNHSAAAPVKVADKQSAASVTAAKPARQPAPTAVKEMASLPVASAAGDKTGNQSMTAPIKTAENQPAVSAAAGSAADAQQKTMPANAQEAPRYTQDMPVEEIVKLMTLEEAKNVVVETGVCKGWTMGEVAERRAPSLKFYVCVDTKITSNIVRAAAQIMWEKVSREKAS